MIACGTEPSADPSIAPAPPPPATATDRFGRCEDACAQHCSAVPDGDRPACELGQVRCGCAPGMRRPPTSVGAPVAAAPVHTPGIPAIDPAVVTPTTPSAPSPSTSVPECFGPAVPLTLWEATPHVELRHGASAHGSFLVDFGTTGSTVDVAVFGPPDPGSGGVYFGVSFFEPRSLRLTPADHSGLAMPFRQAGILGTDVLSQHAYTIDFSGSVLRRAEPGAFCSDAALAEAGHRHLDTSFYGPARDVRRPNVPAVLVRIGGASAPAQLDTGFADRRTRHAINVNQAFFDAIVAAGTTLTPVPDGDLTLTTCVPGVRQPVRAYRIEGAGLGFVAADGSDAMVIDDATVFLKTDVPAAARCGGVSTWTEPAAQLGASLIAAMGIVSIDPGSGAVWIAPAR